MKLNRESKEGTILEFNYDNVLATIGLTLGVLAVGNFFSLLYDAKVYHDLKPNSSEYSKQVESVFDIDLTSSEQKETLNSLGSYLNLVAQYNSETSSEAKQQIADKIAATRGNVKKEIFDLIIESNIQDAESNKEQYSIDKVSKIYNEWGIYRDENGEKVVVTRLSPKEEALIAKVIELELEEYNGSYKYLTDNFVTYYGCIIKDAVFYTGEEAQKEGKAK